MKITVELSDRHVKALKSYLNEIDEPSNKEGIRDEIQQEINTLFEGDGTALSYHYQEVNKPTEY